jgi:hypothetical protein
MSHFFPVNDTEYPEDVTLNPEVVTIIHNKSIFYNGLKKLNNLLNIVKQRNNVC